MIKYDLLLTNLLHVFTRQVPIELLVKANKKTVVDQFCLWDMTKLGRLQIE